MRSYNFIDNLRPPLEASWLSSRLVEVADQKDGCLTDEAGYIWHFYEYVCVEVELAAFYFLIRNPCAKKHGKY